jgi:cytochrome b561/polyisoprenoid-binding protein YceI
LASERYTPVAAILHWTIAALIIGQIAGGLYMHGLPNASPIKFDLYQLHKSFGLTILVLSLARLGWRLTHKPPALPAAMPAWEKFAARAVHWAFYTLLILTPLAGWAIVSVSPTEIPTKWFGLIPVPHLPFFGGETSRDLEEMMGERHETLAFAILFLLALHVGAALKHHFINKDSVLRSMIPERKRQWMGAGAIAAVLLAGSAFYLVAPGPRAASAGETVVGHSHDEGEEHEHAAAAAADDESDWVVDYGASRLVFIGEDSGGRFEGKFADYDADISFDPDDLDGSKISVKVKTASAGTGDALRDSNLPGSEWFDVKSHSEAEFRSTDIRAAGGSYEADGVLTIKEFEKPVTLAFDLVINGADAVATGGADLVRTDFGLGTAPAWLNDEGVALAVRVEFEIHAARKK